MLDLLKPQDTLRRSQIIVDEDIQIRIGGIDPETVENYRTAYENGEPMPPIVVYPLGDRYLLADGFHRIAAQALLHGEESDYVVAVRIEEGDRTQAEIHATTANVGHGRPLSRAEKQQGIRRLLRITDWSYSEIARRLAVVHTTVSRIDEREGVRASRANAQDGAVVTVTRNGATYEMQTRNIGESRPAPAPARLSDDDEIQVAVDWLARYRDGDRTWSDLSDTQIHHANSPCFQAWVKAHPEIRDHKLRIKQAMYRLRQAPATPAVSAPPPPPPVTRQEQARPHQVRNVTEALDEALALLRQVQPDAEALGLSSIGIIISLAERCRDAAQALG